MELNFSFYDVGYFLKKNQKILFFFLIFLLLGIVVGIIIAASSDSYLSLLTTSDKVFYDYVNGKASFSKQSTKLLLSSLVMEILLFLLSLNFYTGFLLYIIIGYQGSIMFLSITAVIAQHGFRGVLMSLFLALPVNLILISSNIIFSCVCLSRCYQAKKNKLFSYGLNDKNFWFIILGLMAFMSVLSSLIIFIFSIILRGRIFIIF